MNYARSRKKLATLFAPAAIVFAGLLPSHAASPIFADGTIITLQSDTGKYAARCNGCFAKATLPNNIAVHVTDPTLPYARFHVKNLPNGKISLRTDDGTYITRCNGCVTGGAYPDFLMTTPDLPTPAYEQFTVSKLANGKYTFQADTGLYIARCRNCAPNAAKPDNVTIHIKDNTLPYAQWGVSLVNPIVIGSAVPHDIARKPASNAYEVELAQFAWQQFVALGWQSTYDPTNKNYQRGVADTKWNGKGVPSHTVWETFAHRSELRPYGVPLTAPFSSLPNYITKVRTDGDLAQGKNQSGGAASLTLLNNLDEDNEIGSADIYLGAVPDTKSTPLVLYQAKASEDEYKYVKQNFGADQFKQNGLLAAAAANNAKNIKALKAYFKGPNGQPDYNTCATPSNVPANSAITLPCGKIGGILGAIEIKTAYYKIPDGQAAKFADFFVRDAIYYTQGLNADGTGNGKFTYHNAKFALLGMHIIHKTENFPGFIFSSFEHNALSSMDFGFKLLSPVPPLYGNFNPHGAKTPANAGDGSQIGNLVPVKRQVNGSTPPKSNGELYPIPDQYVSVNGAAQTQLAALGSVWASYKLIGVQALQTNSYAANASGLAGPNHFMANHVIESDAFLGNFFGPGFSSTNAVFPTGPKFPDGSQNGDNSLYQGKTFNVGGCKGCHGVAQTAFGTDSSFLLDFAGKPVTEPDTIFYVKPKPQK